MATYAINTGAIVECQIIGRLHGQRTRNTFHYRYGGTVAIPDGVAELTALLADFITTVASPMMALQSNEWEREATSIQVISPTRYRAIFDIGGGSGGVQGESLPSGVSVVLRRQAIAAGRQYQGRIYVPGIPVSQELDSQLTAAARDLWQTFAAQLAVPLDGPGSLDDFVPVVHFGADANALDAVHQVVCDENLRYQRRREVGVGE